MKKIRYLIIILITFFINRNYVFAGSLSVWASANSVTTGSTVTISVKANSVFGKYNIKSSNSEVLSGPTDGNVDDGETSTYTFTAKSAGTVTITVVPTDMADYDTEGVYNQSKSVSINVVNKKSPEPNNKQTGGTTVEVKEKSGNNELNSLSVDNYELVPKFSKDILEYKLELDEDIEKINIKAVANNNKAEITGIGERQLTQGENKIELKVTAENGNERVYKIIATVKDLHPIIVTIDNKKYTILKKNKDIIKKPDYYEEEKIKIDNKEVISYINKTTKTRLVILKDSENKLNYYVYDEKNKQYTKYKSISNGNISLQLLSYNKKINNYKKYKIKINDEDVEIYKIKNKDEFGLIYGINQVTGNTGFYQYDEKEKTLSRYNDKIIVDKSEDYKKEINKYKNYLIISIGVTCLILIIITIKSLIKSKNKKRKP